MKQVKILHQKIHVLLQFYLPLQVPDKYSNENVIKAYLLRSRDTLVEARNVSDVAINY